MRHHPLLGRHCLLRHCRALAVAQPDAEPDLQLCVSGTAAAAPTAASAATSGDADVSGWVGDRGHGHLSAAASAATPAASAADGAW